MMLMLRRKKPWKPPTFKVDTQLLDDATAVLSAGILRNIVQQKQGSGAILKRNAPSTLRAKREAGHGSRSLVAALHRFVQVGAWVRKGWNGRVLTIGPSSAELARIARHVIGMGYTGWLLPDAQAIAGLRAALRAFAHRAVKGSR